MPLASVDFDARFGIAYPNSVGRRSKAKCRGSLYIINKYTIKKGGMWVEKIRGCMTDFSRMVDLTAVIYRQMRYNICSSQSSGVRVLCDGSCY